MKIKEFVEKYTKAQEKQEFVEKHIKNNYIPYLTKCVYCDKIIKASSTISNGDVIKINSASQYVAFVMRLIQLYTDLEVDFKNAEFVNQYDSLAEVGAIIRIMNAISEQEYSEFKMILDFKNNDFRENEYSLTAFLYNFKKSLNITEETINTALEQVIKQVK